MSYEDEFGKVYEFWPLYDAYSNLGEPEATALRQVLRDAGFMGFAELCDRAKMLCYEIDSEYWDAHPPYWEKATKKSRMLSKSHRFNVVNYQRMMPIDLDESEYNKVIGGEDSGVWFTDSINGKDFVGSAYYHPNDNKLYHVYYDGNYDEEDVEQFSRLRHAFVYYDDEDDDYSASTKKSRMLSKSFNDMVKSIRRSASGQIIKSEGNLE